MSVLNLRTFLGHLESDTKGHILGIKFTENKHMDLNAFYIYSVFIVDS